MKKGSKWQKNSRQRKKKKIGMKAKEESAAGLEERK